MQKYQRQDALIHCYVHAGTISRIQMDDENVTGMLIPFFHIYANYTGVTWNIQP